MEILLGILLEDYTVFDNLQNREWDSDRYYLESQTPLTVI